MAALQGKLFGATASLLMMQSCKLGVDLGIFRALVDAGEAGLTQEEVETKCSLKFPARYLLLNLTVNGVIKMDGGRFSMSAESAVPLLDSTSPLFMGGPIAAAISLLSRYESTLAHFKEGSGAHYYEQGKDIADATEMFFKPTYLHHLVSYLIPQAPEVLKKMQDGCAVLDLGCGLGLSTLLLARAFPKSTFVGVDYDADAIAKIPSHHGDLPANVKYEAGDAMAYGQDASFDVVVMCDCWHDMYKPSSVSENIRRILRPDGVVYLLEPVGCNSEEENLKLGPAVLLTGFGYSICQVCSRGGGMDSACLGPMLFDSEYEKIWNAAGFSTFVRVELDPTKAFFNRLFVIKK